MGMTLRKNKPMSLIGRDIGLWHIMCIPYYMEEDKFNWWYILIGVVYGALLFFGAMLVI